MRICFRSGVKIVRLNLKAALVEMDIEGKHDIKEKNGKSVLDRSYRVPEPLIAKLERCTRVPQSFLNRNWARLCDVGAKSLLLARDGDSANCFLKGREEGERVKEHFYER